MELQDLTSSTLKGLRYMLEAELEDLISKKKSLLCRISAIKAELTSRGFSDNS